MTNPYYFVRDQRHCLSLMSYKGQIQKIQKLRSVIPKPKSIRELGRDNISPVGFILYYHYLGETALIWTFFNLKLNKEIIQYPTTGLIN